MHTQHAFLSNANDWICDGYTATVSYIVLKSESESVIWHASIIFAPIPPSEPLEYHLSTDIVSIGRFHITKRDKSELLSILEFAVQGKLNYKDIFTSLSTNGKLSYYSGARKRDAWSNDLQLEIYAENLTQPDYDTLVSIDDSLRAASPPFDGLEDVASALGFPKILENNRARIQLRIHPPVAINVIETKFEQNLLSVVLNGHPKYDMQTISLALKKAPSNRQDSRLQIGQKLTWKTVNKEGNILLEGTTTIDVAEYNSAELMLLVDKVTAQRQWFSDPTKLNRRYLAINAFDQNLKMVRRALFEDSDSQKFELGVASLFFSLGFTPCVQVETDSPDIIVESPSGRFLLIECTLRTADTHQKIGKLVDRRGNFSKILQPTNFVQSPLAILFCRCPNDQIAINKKELLSQKIVLISEDELLHLIQKITLPLTPDKIVEDFDTQIAQPVPPVLDVV